jgi:hypothetical protein
MPLAARERYGGRSTAIGRVCKSKNLWVGRRSVRIETVTERGYRLIVRSLSAMARTKEIFLVQTYHSKRDCGWHFVDHARTTKSIPTSDGAFGTFIYILFVTRSVGPSTRRSHLLIYEI